jgi:predicted enzyme involved in methoxymalonyl-ACP biosynthesis
MKSSDPNIEMARLQREISRKLELPLDNLIFDYTAEGDAIRLELITINPKHDQSFLFHAVVAADKLTALSELLEYVAQTFRKEQSYTVQWARKAGELHTSYFRARDMYEVLDKFYHGRVKEDYLVFNITLNPIA